MPHSFYKIWLHVVFSTKEREPLIDIRIKKIIYQYMSGQLNELGCRVKIINGMPDHMHLLFLLNPQRSISEVVKQIKGSSSHWINQDKIINRQFAWQTGYGVFSISESQLEKVYNYIKNQKEHHKKKTFGEEFSEFIKYYNISQTDVK
jgi:REP element-mobilizing transposase RayT